MSRQTSMTPGHGSGTASAMYVHSGQAVTQSKALVGASFVPAQA